MNKCLLKKGKAVENNCENHRNVLPIDEISQESNIEGFALVCKK